METAGKYVREQDIDNCRKLLPETPAQSCDAAEAERWMVVNNKHIKEIEMPSHIYYQIEELNENYLRRTQAILVDLREYAKREFQ
jgi:hypothetical protein